MPRRVNLAVSRNLLDCFQLQRSGDVDAVANGPIDWTELGVEIVHAFCGFPVRLRGAQVIGDMNALHHQHVVFLFDLADDISTEIAIACLYLTRLQRAAKGAGESATGRGDEIVEGRGMGLVLGHVHAIAFGDLRMNAKEDRFGFWGDEGATQRTAYTFNAYIGLIDHGIGHPELLSKSTGRAICP